MEDLMSKERIKKIKIALGALPVTCRYLNTWSDTCLMSLCALSAELWHMPNFSPSLYPFQG